jgi:PLP dependent protein
MSSIPANLQQVGGRIAASCAAARRPVQSVTLLAVSKTQPSSAVRDAFNAGQRSFGENYVQEALDKIAALQDLRADVQWHLIGPLQSNKTKAVAEVFDWVHSVDRLKVAERLSAQRPSTMAPLNVCLQVNVSGEATKSGVMPADVAALAQAVARLPGLKLRGLMSIPEPTDDVAVQRQQHAMLAGLLRQLNADHALHLDTLSMGMSADMDAAIAEGATIVRVGTAIFGARLTSPTTPSV